MTSPHALLTVTAIAVIAIICIESAARMTPDQLQAIAIMTTVAALVLIICIVAAWSVGRNERGDR